jgi:alkylation response protein AidB-like acyl-CoA dehydrogenase
MEVLRRADLEFLLFEWLDVESLARLDRFSGQTGADYRAILDLAERVALKEFLPAFKIGDAEEPRLTEDGRVLVQPKIAGAVRAFFDAGLHLATVDAENGGLQLPVTVATAVMANVMAANIAASGFPLLSIGNARVLTNFGTPAQIEAFAVPQFEGHALGTMCISEPDAGSSVGDVTTRAEPDGDDALGRRYRLRGRKMWISGGGQDVVGNTIHLVLAKIPGPDSRLPPGAKGTSLFVVPAVLPEALGGVRNDVVVAGLNHKMGYRGLPNCVLNFGEGGEGALGWLIGESGEGMRIMFQMMNEARINVGLGAAALAYRGYLQSRAYAAERRQGRRLGSKNESPPVPILEHSDVRRMVLAQKAIAEGALALCLYSARLVDLSEYGDDESERARAKALLDLLTPVTKTWPSEMGLVANQLAIQIHGGYGYTRDYDVEQIFRDNRLNPIHEGTTGIQALDLVGRKLPKDGGRAISAYLRELQGFIASNGAPELEPFVRPLQAAAGDLQKATLWLMQNALTKPDNAGAASMDYLHLFALVALGSASARIAKAALERKAREPQTARAMDAKLIAARFFMERMLPETGPRLARLSTGADTMMSLEAEMF